MLAEDTICFLMDDLKSLPSQNVRNLMPRVFLNDWDSQYCLIKTSIFVRGSFQELANVNEADGDIDKGIEKKTNELQRCLNANNIEYIIENTLFTDSCSAYVWGNKKTVRAGEDNVDVPRTMKKKSKSPQVIVQYDSDLSLEYQQEVTEKISELINRLRVKLQEDAKEIRTKVDKLLKLEHDFENSEVDMELVRVRKDVEEIVVNIPRVSAEDIVELILMWVIDRIHWRTIKKMNSLYGGYGLWHTDIYARIKQAGEEYFANFMKPVSFDIRSKLIDVRNEEVRGITGGYLNTYYSSVANSINKIGESFFQWAMETGFAPQANNNVFWRNVNELHGTGYTKAVRNQYKSNVQATNDVLVGIVTKEIEHITAKLLEPFPEI